MGLLSDCRVGFETFALAFEHQYCYHNKCVHQNSTFDFTSAAFQAYNDTVCGLAEQCHKAACVGESFITCIKEAFCTNATDAVKAVGQVIYQLNKESAYNSAVQTLPWAGAIAVGAFGASVLVDQYATQNKVTKAFSGLSKIVGVCSAGLAAHCYSVIREGKV